MLVDVLVVVDVLVDVVDVDVLMLVLVDVLVLVLVDVLVLVVVLVLVLIDVLVVVLVLMLVDVLVEVVVLVLMLVVVVLVDVVVVEVDVEVVNASSPPSNSAVTIRSGKFIPPPCSVLTSTKTVFARNEEAVLVAFMVSDTIEWAPALLPAVNA